MAPHYQQNLYQNSLILLGKLFKYGELWDQTGLVSNLRHKDIIMSNLPSYSYCVRNIVKTIKKQTNWKDIYHKYNKLAYFLYSLIRRTQDFFIKG